METFRDQRADNAPLTTVVVYVDDGTGGLPRGLRWMLDHPRLMDSRPVRLLYRVGIAKSPIIDVRDVPSGACRAGPAPATANAQPAAQTTTTPTQSQGSAPQ